MLGLWIALVLSPFSCRRSPAPANRTSPAWPGTPMQRREPAGASHLRWRTAAAAAPSQ